MKKFLITLLSLFFTMMTNAQNVKMYFETANPVVFDGTQFYLGWSSHPSQAFYLQEYFPKGESADFFNEMFTINLLQSEATARQAVTVKIMELKKRQASDSFCSFKPYQDGDDYYLDFVVSDQNGDSMTTLEWNIHKYQTVVIDGKSYCMLIFYTRRAYKEQIEPFLKKLPDIRNVKFPAMVDLKLDIKQIR